jgi:hypothetical protein
MKKREGVHKLTINLPEDLVKRAKLKAVREDTTLSDTIASLLEAWLKRRPANGCQD